MRTEKAIQKFDSPTGRAVAGGRSKRVVFFTMVLHPVKGWIRVGNAYPTRKAAAEWLPFVRGAWRGTRAKVTQCTVWLDANKVSEESRKVLDKKFNLDAD
jgi:hypothetical protein